MPPKKRKAEEMESLAAKTTGVMTRRQDGKKPELEEVPNTDEIPKSKNSGDLFKARANELKAALECGPGWNVKIDTKIRKGCFEAGEVGGAAIIHLMDMKEPYQDWEDLDVEAVVAAAIAL